ncbi:uncharacterized protein LOC127257522 [Andrographis paniculata]|uniref:uncharacterized protein LOC127257522 n=1 Tax=Andrographis paniculata TaxID=175694 RepID=UPI0021E82FEF|nr:uncharacterized protein LOC127257522 [Andrographis paniculata]
MTFQQTSMSWLARSIANTLRLQEDDEDHLQLQEEDENTVEDRRLDTTLSVSAAQDLRLSDCESDCSGDEDAGDDCNQGRGVKEDLSEFRDNLTRQLWSVASFLAPPPPRQGSDSLRLEESESDRSVSETDADENEELVDYDARLACQFAEQGSLSSSENHYSDIVEEAVGITDEVLAFARNIAHHPETWLDFPLSEEEDFDDFEISDAQHKHALAVEHLSTRLAALRIELCPVHMSVGYFWMVYFLLLYSRLNKHDADALSLPQLVKARAMWMQALQKQTNELYGFGVSTSHLKEIPNSPRENAMIHFHGDAQIGNMSDQISPESLRDEIVKHPVNVVEFVDKSVIREDLAPILQDKEMITSSSLEPRVKEANDDDNDDWLKEDADLIGYSSQSVMVSDEDISFSDLEDDCNAPVEHKVFPS